MSYPYTSILPIFSFCDSGKDFKNWCLVGRLWYYASLKHTKDPYGLYGNRLCLLMDRVPRFYQGVINNNHLLSLLISNRRYPKHRAKKHAEMFGLEGDYCMRNDLTMQEFEKYVIDKKYVQRGNMGDFTLEFVLKYFNHIDHTTIFWNGGLELSSIKDIPWDFPVKLKFHEIYNIVDVEKNINDTAASIDQDYMDLYNPEFANTPHNEFKFPRDYKIFINWCKCVYTHPENIRKALPQQASIEYEMYNPNVSFNRVVEAIECLSISVICMNLLDFSYFRI